MSSQALGKVQVLASLPAQSVPREAPLLWAHEDTGPAFGLPVESQTRGGWADGWQPGPAAKRALDILVSAILLVLFAAFMAVIALGVKLDSPGPVLYSAPRAGKRGRLFRCHKFRTMVANAGELKDKLRVINEREGPCFKVTCDPRVTSWGHFLRRYSLDELPQLWNVLRGEMSLVGPRPHPVDDVRRYQAHHLRRLEVTPGLTGLWQVTARRDPSFRRALALDLEYIERQCLWLDLQILWRTAHEVISGSGV